MDDLGQRVAGGRGHDAEDAPPEDHTADQLAQHRRLTDPLGELAAHLPDHEDGQQDEQEARGRVGARAAVLFFAFGRVAFLLLCLDDRRLGRDRGRGRPDLGRRRPVSGDGDEEEAGEGPEQQPVPPRFTCRPGSRPHRPAPASLTRIPPAGLRFDLPL